jgi:hypothetical protein
VQFELEGTPNGQNSSGCLTETACYIQTMLVSGIRFQEYAKLEYGRLLWRVPAYRERLLRHRNDPRHPHAERFAEHKTDVRYVLESPKESDAQLDVELRRRNLSLRVVVKEIPSVFGSFF